MNTRVQAQGFSLTPAIAARAHRQIGRALKRFAENVLSVDVYLKDINGPRGGDDKQALVRVQLKHRAPVMIETTHDDLYAAIDLSARRVRRTVRRALGRKQHYFRGDSRRLRMIQALSGEL